MIACSKFWTKRTRLVYADVIRAGLDNASSRDRVDKAEGVAARQYAIRAAIERLDQ
jgi:hypothetical protein